MTPFIDWLKGSALPTWATQGFDPARGRFHERLDLAGRPLAVPHRAMVQARQIYVFAHAAELGWYDGGHLAEQAMRHLCDTYLEERDGEASFAFSVTADGRPASAVRDAYTHAFALFALAWLHRLTGDPKLLDLADRVIRFMDRHLADPVHGGLFDTTPSDDRSKRQNPLMHLLEAYLFLHATAPERDYLRRADDLVALFKHRLFDERHGVLLEYFAPDWSPHPDPARADRWEPGHHYEWVWLLHEHQRLAGQDHGSWIARLHASAGRHGLAANGLLVDETHADGRVAKPSHRLWPHTEAIKAAVAQARAGDPAAPALAAAMAERLIAVFLDRSFAGGWIDQFGADGAALVDYVPASSLYHLFLAGTEAAQAPVPAA